MNISFLCYKYVVLVLNSLLNGRLNDSKMEISLIKCLSFSSMPRKIEKKGLKFGPHSKNLNFRKCEQYNSIREKLGLPSRPNDLTSP